MEDWWCGTSDAGGAGEGSRGNGRQASLPSQELPFSADPVLLIALFIVSSLEPFVFNRLVNCYELEPESF